MRSRIVFVGIISLMTACKQTDCENKHLESYFKNLTSELYEDTPEYIYFVSFGGCRSCVIKSIAFSKEFINDKRIVFVLASQSGRKRIAIHYNKQDLSSTNFVLDITDYPYLKNLTGIYATLYYLEDECYVKKEVTPISMTDDLNNIRENLSGFHR